MSRVTRNQEEYLNGQTQEVEEKLLTFEDFRNINVDAPESARDKKARRPVCASGKKSPVWKYFFQAWGLPEGICRFCAQAIVQGSDSTSLKRHLRQRHLKYYRLVELEELKQKDPDKRLSKGGGMNCSIL